MRYRLTMTRSTLALVILILPLAGCVGIVPALPATNHPRLEYPPPKVVDALEDTARGDPDSEEWVINLDRFYQKQDASSVGQ